MSVITRRATIANGASVSGAIDVRGMRLVGIHMPADWTAAGMTFTATLTEDTLGASNDYYAVHNDAGTEVAFTVAADRYVVIQNNLQIGGAKWLKVRSGTAGVPVNQGAARVVILSFVEDN